MIQIFEIDADAEIFLKVAEIGIQYNFLNIILWCIIEILLNGRCPYKGSAAVFEIT